MHSETTHYNYLIAAARLGRYRDEHPTPEPDAVAAANGPYDVIRARIKHF